MVKKRSKIKRIIAQYVLELAKRGITINRLILYGSYAKGHPRAFSDIDIAVISPNFRRLGILRTQELLGEANMFLEEPIQALGYTPEQYAHAEKGSFLDEIKRTGIPAIIRSAGGLRS